MIVTRNSCVSNQYCDTLCVEGVHADQRSVQARLTSIGKTSGRHQRCHSPRTNTPRAVPNGRIGIARAAHSAGPRPFKEYQ